ncbi:hypothetical protein EKH77_00030 [Streptomyces luteoverticillatus]|uniref:Uncharacterized protein n=1 Tax=Streptomyces luteoverticillatus TaxID=66425 RepID=A0A3Q9FSU4_STRLT|nr:hypothetical protein [Streptomyces luteoverticillatus]AZQ69826.1 hypothetical protein EKH77_00030 [Streptomyces luteoverticillatus]
MAAVGGVAAGAGLVWPFIFSMFIPHAASCGEVMEFAGGHMPQQATDKKCVNEGAWLDRTYSAEFTMPREGVAARLREAFPRVDDGDCAGDLCLWSLRQSDKPAGQAAIVELSVNYQSQNTARVKLSAFNT